MAVVSPKETRILMQMGFAEWIIPAMNQEQADREIAEFYMAGAPLARIPGQTGGLAGAPGPAFGTAEGVFGLTVAGEEPGTALRTAFPDPTEALKELADSLPDFSEILGKVGDLIPDIPNLTLIVVVLGLIAVAVIVFKVA